MAYLRLLLLVTVLIFCLLQVSTIELEADQVERRGQVDVRRGGNRRLTTDQDIDCGGLCGVRCSLHSRPNLCKRACGTCCARCKCVPPGTSGNREVCGTCYTDMKTHGNKTKCP